MNTEWRVFFAIFFYVLIGSAFAGWSYHNTCFDRSPGAYNGGRGPCSAMSGGVWPVALPGVAFANLFQRD